MFNGFIFSRKSQVYEIQPEGPGVARGKKIFKKNTFKKNFIFFSL